MIYVLATAVGFVSLGLLMWAAGAFEDPIQTASRVARMREAYLRNTDPEMSAVARRGGAAAAYYLFRNRY
jgi:hypothetical protein